MSREQLEQFRALQHPALLPVSPQTLRSGGTAELPDEGRVILHFDIDAFYAQVEEVRNPDLRNRPLGVTQKYLIVTSNYHARARGVTKLQNIYDAKVKCPEIVLVSGEDLSPYRQASRAVLAVLARFGVVEKGGMDEAFVDVTREAKLRVAQGSCPASWHGHLHLGETELVADNPHRPMDLRVLAQHPSGGVAASAAELVQGAGSWQALLRAGSAIAAEARAAMKAEAGYRSSAGIACNKLMAKLSSGLHKPDDQTILPPPVAAAFIAPLPVRVIQGVGYKMDGELQQLGIQTASDLRQQPKATLVRRFGERTGVFLYLASRGKDSSPVVPVGPPKTVTVEDSFKGCPSIEAARRVAKVLAPDLLVRLQEEHEEFGRRPAKLLLKWRLQGQGYHNHNTRASASCNMPPVVQAPFQGLVQAEAIEKAAITLLSRNVSSPFNLTLLNMGATNFSQPAAANGMFNSVRPQSGASGSSAAAMDAVELSRRAADAATAARRDYTATPAGAALSKRAERAMREGAGGAACAVDLLPSDATSLQRFPHSSTQQPAQRQSASLQKNSHRHHAAWGGASSEPQGCCSGSEDGDGDGDFTDEWRDIMQSQQQPQEGRRLSSAGAAASAIDTQQGPPATLQRHHSSGAAAEEHGILAGSATDRAAAVPVVASAKSVAGDPLPPALPGAAAAEELAVAQRPLSEQELADRQLAEELQREEATAEADRRRRSRELFLAGASAATATGQRSTQPLPKRLKAGGPLDMFVRKRS